MAKPTLQSEIPYDRVSWTFLDIIKYNQQNQHLFSYWLQIVFPGHAPYVQGVLFFKHEGHDVGFIFDIDVDCDPGTAYTRNELIEFYATVETYAQTFHKKLISIKPELSPYTR